MTGPLPFAGYSPVIDREMWQKILSGEVEAFVYSTRARGDLSPVPISAAEFFLADQSGQVAHYGEPDPALAPYQIMVCDRDRRRPAAVRHRIEVPHWVYVMKSAATAADKRSSPGAPEIYDWDDIAQFVRKAVDNRGDFRKPENRVDGWRSQNDLIELIKDYLQRRDQAIPGPTQFKRKVAAILRELPTDH